MTQRLVWVKIKKPKQITFWYLSKMILRMSIIIIVSKKFNLPSVSISIVNCSLTCKELKISSILLIYRLELLKYHTRNRIIILFYFIFILIVLKYWAALSNVENWNLTRNRSTFIYVNAITKCSLCSFLSIVLKIRKRRRVSWTEIKVSLHWWKWTLVFLPECTQYFKTIRMKWCER